MRKLMYVVAGVLLLSLAQPNQSKAIDLTTGSGFNTNAKIEGIATVEQMDI